jgi:hypothetical protein
MLLKATPHERFRPHGESQKGDALGYHVYVGSVYARSYLLEPYNRDQIQGMALQNLTSSVV